MKTIKTFILILSISFFVIACKKDDTIQPVITLNGNPEQVVNLNGVYQEQGATAMDNQDGDLSNQILISGSVDVNESGEYRMYYDVEDSEGNKAATAIRFVQVVNQADYLTGTYLATPNCSGTSTVQDYNTTVTTSSTVNNRIYIKRVIQMIEDEPVIGEINGSIINIPYQTVGPNTIQGTASIAGDGFLLSVTIDGDITYNCDIDHVKI